MKHLKFLCWLLVGLFITSCQRDEIKEEIVVKNHPEIQLRSYNQEDCGFINSFCEKRSNYVVAVHELEPFASCPNPPCFVGGGEDGSSMRIMPVKIFDGSTAVYIEDDTEAYFMINSEHPAFEGKTVERVVPNEIRALLDIEYRDISDGTKLIEDIQSSGRVSLSSTNNGVLNINPTDGGGTVSALVRYCDYYRTSDVESFIEVFFDESTDQSHIRGFIEDAFENAENNADCSIEGYTGSGYSKCRYNCIDPRCIVDYLLEIDAGLSDFQKNVLVSRYLGEALGLTDQEVNWLSLPSNNDVLTEVYNGLLTDQNLGRCEKEDCGQAGGYHEFIKQNMAGETLTADETEGLLEFFSVMSCDDPVIYSCFREAQQNPDSDIAIFLEEVKSVILNESNSLLNGCDDLTSYTDTWFELGSLDPNIIPEVKNKLEQLGDEYWIQTIENATNNNDRWWRATPTINLDFFGITINVLPNNPITGNQFTPEEFIDYIQLNFASPEFMGDGNVCGASFDFINSNEQTNWTDGDATTSVLTISMPDDGNVIASEHISGEYWTFSTLNAPGWLEGDSWDGYHPVSGNRRFGLLQNLDSTYTFYTTGVDRLTGWWHTLLNPLVGAFEEADELWACVLGLIGDFVNDNGGTASTNLDCTTVRPKWPELRDAIKQGCEGFTDTISDFPCEQAEPCQ